jgi:hypothetical protein
MQECDLLINSIVPTVQYNKIMDLTTYWLYDYFALVIPIPDETANINAVIKPFQWPLHQTGLVAYWDLWFLPMPPQCNGKPPSGNKGPQKKSSLSFKNLTGAFILIGVIGLSFSFLAFLCELIVSIHKRRHRRTRNNMTGPGSK